MKREERSESFRRTALWILISAACYYFATQLAWALCFPNSKVSLFFPPHAVLVSVLLLVPTRNWWAFTLAAASGHFLATQQAHWPFFYSLHCEAFDAVLNVATAAGLRIFIKSPLKLITLRDAIVFVLIAVVVVPFGTAFWGAGFTISNHFGTHYWVEWRNLGISNAVTAIVLVPAILLGVHQLRLRRIKVTPLRLLEACLLGAGLLTVAGFAFDHVPAGPDTSPALLYAPIPLLVWAALRFGLGGTSASMVIITFLAIWGTMQGKGPFLMQSPAGNALALQMFLLFTATPLMFLAVLIEEEKRSQAALRESEGRFRTIAKSVPVLIWMAGTDKLCNFVNKGWLDFTGRTLEQELGTGWTEGMHQEDADRCLDIYTNSFNARKEFRMEYRLRRCDGAYGWVLDTGVPRFAQDGTFLGYIGSCVDITERKQAEQTAREFGGRLLHAQEAERARLARELHDDITQRLARLAIDAGRVERSGAPPQISDTMREVREGLVRLSEDVHSLSYRLHSSLLDDLGLAEAIKAECERFSRQESIHAEVKLRDLPPILPRDAALGLFRIAQEALRNVARHARASTVDITLRATDGGLQLAVRDNGVGFDPSRKREHLSLGLASMRERAGLLGGELDIESAAGHGTTIVAWVPLKAQKA